MMYQAPPRDAQGPPRDLLGTPRGLPGTPKRSMGGPRASQGPPRDPQGAPRGPPGTSQGPPGTPGTSRDPPGNPNMHIYKLYMMYIYNLYIYMHVFYACGRQRLGLEKKVSLSELEAPAVAWSPAKTQRGYDSEQMRPLNQEAASFSCEGATRPRTIKHTTN